LLVGNFRFSPSSSCTQMCAREEMVGNHTIRPPCASASSAA
jgi:hypothetical protein